MILLNFSHPLTPDQLAQTVELTGQPIERSISLPAQFDHQQPFGPQVDQLIAQIDPSSFDLRSGGSGQGLTPNEWQTAPILVNPPSLNFIAALLLAELHGRMGYFPPIIRLRPIEDALPPGYEVAEILNLQAVRDVARKKRTTR